MSLTDPIAQLLTHIRNAQRAGHESTEVAYSRMRKQIAEILQKEGFIAGYKENEKQPYGTLTILLKYGPGREPAIRRIRRISKPGRRIYKKADQIPPVLGGMGINIISTSRGIMTGKTAREQRVGGELLCEVY